MSTVIFYSAPRELFRPIIVEAHELYSSPAVRFEDEKTLHRPYGPFNAAQELAKFKAPYNNPDVVICVHDPICPPSGLADVRGKKVLLVGDTHHGACPITMRVKTALAEPWDLTVLEFRRSHCHWFAEAGVKNVAYIPGFNLNPRPMAPTRERRRGITFVGQCSPELHPRRHYVLTELQRRGYPILITQTDQTSAARLYNESAVCLNISLNGDFNLRNWEVMAAGGTLVSDVSSALSGSHIKTVDDFEKAIQEHLGNPKQAYYLAQNTQAEFNSYYSTQGVALQLKADAMGGTIQCWGYNDPHVWERIAAYEVLQERHRLNAGDDGINVEFDDPQKARDASDLPRAGVLIA